MARTRLDVLLVEQEHVPNRDTAQRLIRAGQVLVNSTCIDKPGEKVDPEAEIIVKQKETVFASRGGLKLQHALEAFSLDIRNCVAADLGASNGGFTDCLLRKGARKVFAIDVGYGQLAYSLQTDERVVVMDRTNCRYLTPDSFDEPVTFVTGDLSFISILKITPAVASILTPDGNAVLLIKPQFEIGKGKVGRKGIVSRADDHREVLHTCYTGLSENAWVIRDVHYSPIRGKTGNIEFWFWLSRSQEHASVPSERLNTIVEEAHQKLLTESP